MNNEEPQLTARQQFIKEDEERIEKKRHDFYLKFVEKKRLKHEQQLLKYNLKNGLH